MLATWLAIVPTDRRVPVGATMAPLNAPLLDRLVVEMLSTASTSNLCKNSMVDLALLLLVLRLAPVPTTTAAVIMSSRGNVVLLAVPRLGVPATTTLATMAAAAVVAAAAALHPGVTAEIVATEEVIVDEAATTTAATTTMVAVNTTAVAHQVQAVVLLLGIKLLQHSRLPLTPATMPTLAMALHLAWVLLPAFLVAMPWARRLDCPAISAL